HRETSVLIFVHRGLDAVGPVAVYIVNHPAVSSCSPGLYHVVLIIQYRYPGIGKRFACFGIPYHYYGFHTTYRGSAVKLVHSRAVAGKEACILGIVKAEGKV